MSAHTTHSPQPVARLPRGRFAPSPTGPLHFGSLVAAVASYLDVRSRGGTWFVRIEDLDPPREIAGAADAILRTLEACGLEWDGPIAYQSERHERYALALARLQQAGCVYPCGCTRREVADSALHGIEGPVYPGTCRAGLPAGREARAWRVRTAADPIAFVDELQGPQRQNIERQIGDFILRRADSLYAYQLAVVVDDAEQEITRVVRGADLLHSTARQIYLQRLLGMPTPAYLHVPVAVNAFGEKLSKQTLAEPIDRRTAGTTLIRVLRFLGQSAPAGVERANPGEILAWAREHWDPQTLPRTQSAATRPERPRA
jgi:glutamyl-Q tRNA(Asp) synthetase